VVRNRLKRRMREAVRLELGLLSSEWSIVFNPRRKTLDCTFTELQTEVRRLFMRCGRAADLSILGQPSSGQPSLDSSKGTNS
jgi:ribonuclease P protein component